jgi:hypothetical protein
MAAKSIEAAGHLSREAKGVRRERYCSFEAVAATELKLDGFTRLTSSHVISKMDGEPSILPAPDPPPSDKLNSR